MEFSVTFTTLWTYIKEVKGGENNPLVFYTLVSSAFLFASLSLSAMVGHLVDKHRRIRVTFFTVNCVVILGNVLYSIPLSPWFLVLGRLLSGTAGPLRSVMSGEVARSFHSDDLSGKLTWMGMSYAVGFMLGPTINIFFKNLHVAAWGLTITKHNIPGIMMASLFSISTLIAFFFLHDLSRIYDLKKHVMEMEDHEECAQAISYEDAAVSDAENPLDELNETSKLLRSNSPLSTPSFLRILRRLFFSNFDVTFMLVFSFFESYFSLSFIMWLSLIVVEKLHWTLTATNMIMTGTSVSALIPCLIISRWPISNAQLLYVAVCSQFALIVMYIITEIFFHRLTEDFAVNVLLWVVWVTMYAFLVVVEEVFLVGTLAKMVSSEHQVFADGVRLTVYRLGAITALSSSALVFEYMDVVAPMHGCVVVVLAALLVVRRERFKNPKVVIR